MSEATRQKMIATKSANPQVWSAERRMQHSATMKRVAKERPESYSSSNRGRTKQIEFDGIKFQGKWELEFYQFVKSQGMTITRVTEAFPYEWEGSVHSYYPDFYVKELKMYFEVKGYETERDRQKWLCFPHPLRIIRKAEMRAIRRKR